jgi:hypothetical protein
LEAGGYETYGPTLLSWTGNALGPGSTANIAPYVRAAYQWMWNDQAAHVGALLLSANINPASRRSDATPAATTRFFSMQWLAFYLCRQGLAVRG